MYSFLPAKCIVLVMKHCLLILQLKIADMLSAAASYVYEEYNPKVVVFDGVNKTNVLSKSSP